MQYTDKEFAKLLKKYLVDVSARTMSDAYFNIADNTVVLCNSSSNKAGTMFGDRLTSFCVGELSFHIVKFIDPTFLNVFKEVFKIPSDYIYAINVSKLSAITNKVELADLDITMLNGILDVVPKGTEYSSDKHDVGRCIYDFHILDMLNQWYNYINNLGTAEHRTKYPHVFKEFIYERPAKQDYILKVDLTEFGDALAAYRDTINYIVHDGLSTPSIRSFVPAKSKLYEYIWSENDSIFIMFGYSDEVVTIRSIRPNVRAIPIPKLTNIDILTDFQYG